MRENTEAELALIESVRSAIKLLDLTKENHRIVHELLTKALTEEVAK
jgi:hypothetical protein